MFHTLNTNGTLKTTIDAVSAASFINGGFAYTADGALHVVIAGATLSDVFYNGGKATTAQGEMYITSDTPAESAVVNGGVLCRADGAVHVGVAGGSFAGGMPVSPTGAVFYDPIDTAELDLSNITHTAIPVRGDVTPSMTRATAKTITNNDGYQVTLLANELGFPGARRVDNLVRLGAAQSSTLAVAANVTMTLPAGAYQFSMGAGTGRATFSGTGGATGTLAASASARTFVAKTITAGTFVVTASVADLVDLQVVSLTGETDQTTIRPYISVGALDYRNAKDPLFYSTPGTVNHSASTPDSPANSPTGDFAVVVGIIPTLWKGAAYQCLLGKDNNSGSAGDRSFDLGLSATTGIMRVQLSIDGTAIAAAVDSTAAPSFPNASLGYLAYTRNSTTGVITFFTSVDGVTWTQLGNTVASGVTGAIYNNALKLMLMTGNQTSAAYGTAGGMRLAQIYNGIPPMLGGAGSATPVVDFNPHRDAVTPTGTITSSTTGEVWTLNGASSVVRSVFYHGSGVDGVKCFPTDLSGNPLTGMTAPLIELAATNRCKYSEDFTNAAWVSGGGGIAVTPNTAVAPDGTTTADTLTASGANGTLIQDLGVVASAEKSGGLYLKRKTGTGNVDITMDGGATWTTQTINSATWTRCKKSQTLADEDFGIRIVTSGDEVYAAKAMVATEAELTSYIANLAGSTTTRNADQLYYTGALIGQIKTLACVDFKREAGFANVGVPVGVSDGTAANYVAIVVDASSNTKFDGLAVSAIQWSRAGGAYTPGTLSSMAQSFATNDIKMSKDGVAQTADTVATIPTVTRLEYGMVAGLYQLNGYPGIPYGWTRQLSQSELNAVTA